MFHIRNDNLPKNSLRRFACGLGPELPEGDKYIFEGDSIWHLVDCPGCLAHYGCTLESVKLGTPINGMTNAEFRRIGESWGYP